MCKPGCCAWVAASSQRGVCPTALLARWKGHQPRMSPAGGRYPGAGGPGSPICRSITVSAWSLGTEHPGRARLWDRGPLSITCAASQCIPPSSLSIQRCSPAQTCFPGSPALPTSRNTAKGTQTQPGSCLHPRLSSSRGSPACLHPSLAAAFTCKPSPVAFPASFLVPGGRPGFVLSPVQGWERGGKTTLSREDKKGDGGRF